MIHGYVATAVAKGVSLFKTVKEMVCASHEAALTWTTNSQTNTTDKDTMIVTHNNNNQPSPSFSCVLERERDFYLQNSASKLVKFRK
eukprot:m.67420 g.67420  ORF g.67420 m.67420 type:complete len:87 (-) comp23808_c1_seq1:105-365(-)